MKLTIENLTVTYDQMVIKNLNLLVKDGSFTTLVGHSGTGKSTILKSVAGLIDIEVDDIKLNDESIKNLPAEKRDIGFVFQKPLLFPHLTVEENICFSLDIRKWPLKEKKDRLDELLDLLELKGFEQRLPSELSGGQQQRVAIGRAIAYKPKIILMDEPFSSLDPRLRTTMGDFLKELQIKLKLTIVFVTHDPIEALRLSDRIAFVHNQTIIQYDSPATIFNKPVDRVVGNFFGKVNWIEGRVKDNTFESDFIVKSAPLKNGSYDMFLRPHQISLSSGHDWTVKSVQLIGKETLYHLKCDAYYLWVEVKGSPQYQINDSLSINIDKDIHYLKR